MPTPPELMDEQTADVLYAAVKRVLEEQHEFHRTADSGELAQVSSVAVVLDGLQAFLLESNLADADTTFDIIDALRLHARSLFVERQFDHMAEDEVVDEGGVFEQEAEDLFDLLLEEREYPE
jgi:hypothetical protein